ncbi:hypothetical protein ACIP5Y_00710 [Nocardia sp. NPDC088792]
MTFASRFAAWTGVNCDLDAAQADTGEARRARRGGLADTLHAVTAALS